MPVLLERPKVNEVKEPQGFEGTWGEEAHGIIAGNSPMGWIDPLGLQCCNTAYGDCLNNCVSARLGNVANYIFGLLTSGAIADLSNLPSPAGVNNAQYAIAQALARGGISVNASVIIGFYAGGHFASGAAAIAAFLSGYAVGTVADCAISCGLDRCYRSPQMF